jgi:hypothetical protein
MPKIIGPVTLTVIKKTLSTKGDLQVTYTVECLH